MPALSRFRNLWRGAKLDDEFDEELRFHLDMRIDANLRRGMSRAEAEREARRHLGGTVRAREGMREARVMTGIETFARDIRHGARLFMRQPGTTALAVLTLSLGIGANAVIFSLLYTMLLRPLPFPEPDRLVSVVDNFRTDGTGGISPTVPELLDVRARTQHLEPVSFYDIRDVQIMGGSEPARATAGRVEAAFLSVLGVVPQLGRLFVDGENTPGRDRVVILTDGLWRRNFGAEPSIVGRQITVNAAPHMVLGVLPAGFAFDYLSAEPLELFIPFPMSEAYTSRTAEFGNVRRVTSVARLRPGATLAAASAEVEGISRALAAEHPALYRRGSDGQDLGFSMDVRPLHQVVAPGRRARAVLRLLSAAVGLVLLLACVNTAQFLLARALERQAEVAIRSALGASRLRLARQFLSEALLLALSAGVIGLLQARWLMDVLAARFATAGRAFGELEMNAAVIAFTTGVAMTATLVFGLFPALNFSRTTPLARLENRSIRRSHHRTRHLLIGVEVAISVVLLVTAGMLVRSLWELHRAPGGYSADNVTVMRMRAVPRTTAGRPTGPLYREYLERVAAVSGVAAAAVADAPLPGFPGVAFSIVGRADDAATLSQQRASWRIVSPGYFDVLGVPIREGRTFADDDSGGRPAVAIVNEEMARRFWPGQSAVGQQIRSGVGPRAAVATIVGVAGDVRPVLQSGAVPQIYVSYLQQSEPNITLLVRAAAGASVPAAAIKQAVWSATPDQPMFDIRPMTDVVSQSTAAPRVIAQLLGAFAVLALVISTMGVYMVATYLTSRRTREIALRRAIGAESRDLLQLIAGPTLRWTVAGLVVGVAGAIAVSGALRVVLSTIAGLDAGTIAVVAGLYLAVVAVAVTVPAARALRLDPATILRAE